MITTKVLAPLGYIITILCIRVCVRVDVCVCVVKTFQISLSSLQACNTTLLAILIMLYF